MHTHSYAYVHTNMVANGFHDGLEIAGKRVPYVQIPIEVLGPERFVLYFFITIIKKKLIV